MQLYAGGLSEIITDADLMEFFSPYFQVQSITFLQDLDSGKRKGAALIRILNAENIENTVQQINGSTLKEARVVVRRMPDTLPGEMDFREWLSEHPARALEMIAVRDGQTILDYGCGPGILTIPAGRLAGKDGRVYALDVRARMLELVREKAAGEGLTNIQTLVLDTVKLNTGLEDETVDVVLVYDVMHEIADKAGLLRELYRVIRRGGLLSIFPMHMGTEKMLAIVEGSSLFRFKDRCSPPGYTGASEILNFEKI